jgi:hypothetical protein
MNRMAHSIHSINLSDVVNDSREEGQQKIAWHRLEQKIVLVCHLAALAG